MKIYVIIHGKRYRVLPDGRLYKFLMWQHKYADILETLNALALIVFFVVLAYLTALWVHTF